MGKPALFKGKTKTQIADEAFSRFGAKATLEQVNRHFRNKYGIDQCEPSMYYNAKRKASGLPPYGTEESNNESEEQPVNPKLHRPTQEPTTNGVHISKREAIRRILSEKGMEAEADIVVTEAKKRFNVEINAKAVWNAKSEIKRGEFSLEPKATSPQPQMETPVVESPKEIESPIAATVPEVPPPPVAQPVLAEAPHRAGCTCPVCATQRTAAESPSVTPPVIQELPPITGSKNDPLTNLRAIRGLCNNGVTLAHVKQVLGLTEQISLDGIKEAINQLEELQLQK